VHGIRLDFRVPPDPNTADYINAGQETATSVAGPDGQPARVWINGQLGTPTSTPPTSTATMSAVTAAGGAALHGAALEVPGQGLNGPGDRPVECVLRAMAAVGAPGLRGDRGGRLPGVDQLTTRDFPAAVDFYREVFGVAHRAGFRHGRIPATPRPWFGDQRCSA